MFMCAKSPHGSFGREYLGVPTEGYSKNKCLNGITLILISSSPKKQIFIPR